MGDCGKWKSLDSPLSPWCCMAVVSRVLCLPVPMTLASVSDSPFRIMFCASRRKFIKQYSCTLPTAAEIIHFPVPPISEPTLSCSPLHGNYAIS
ncbi:Subtilisin-like protease [Dirofilaria immitis]